MKICPRCGMPARAIGRVIAASTSDGRHHGVIGLCVRCAVAMDQLPRQNPPSRWSGFLNRALVDPPRFCVKILPDADIAALAVAMCGHRDFALDTLQALNLLD